ncbi:hypothetical protein F4777DRAFT_578231 [Nemania sp. FL0916]|nr:hypothetical protein F4777DRAFT_578231 [Nemania sp. FL0916]
MKLSHSALALVAACPGGLADFWMIYQRRYAEIGRIETTTYGTSFVRDVTEWNCANDTFTHRIFPDRWNVSGTNYGVRFHPWSSLPGPMWHDPLATVEMNLHPSTIGHQTISHEQGYAIIDANNTRSGQCHLNRTFVFDLDCWYDFGDVRVPQFHVNVNGSSMFFCESEIDVNEDTESWNGLLKLDGATQSDLEPGSEPEIRGVRVQHG